MSSTKLKLIAVLLYMPD